MPAAPDLAGSALDSRYELHALIGEGAFGRVYSGLDRRLDRRVAIKVIKPWWAEDSTWVERFEREAQMLARVSDPGIVQIFDIGHAEQGPYYVAELVDGESLAERLQRRSIPIADAVAVAERLCRALASAHARGIVHCDVKPANVLLTTDGRLKVGDFGVARLAGGGTSQPLTATVAGTPRYMAPEQARGRRTTPATDVYSAGVVLYEMLAGEPPFMHGSAVELGLRHVQDVPPPLSERIPRPLREIAARALRKRPEERYSGAAQMADALLATGLGRGAPGESPTHPVDTRSWTGAAGGIESPRSDEPAAGAPKRDGNSAVTKARAWTRLMPRAPTPTRAAGDTMDPEHVATQHRAPRDVYVHRDARRRRGLAALAVAVALAAALVVWLLARSGGGGVAPVKVPSLVGRSSEAARIALTHDGLRYRAALVAAPGAIPGDIVGQSPRSGVSARPGSQVALSVAEQPRWRTLTTFSASNSAKSVPFRIEGQRWRVIYAMSYEGTCTLLLVCFGPSAKASNLRTGASLEGFDLSSGSSHGHTFDKGPGLYQVAVSSGQDSARWSMTVQDYY